MQNESSRSPVRGDEPESNEQQLQLQQDAARSLRILVACLLMFVMFQILILLYVIIDLNYKIIVLYLTVIQFGHLIKKVVGIKSCGCIKAVMNLDSLLNIAFLVLLVYYCEVVRFNINYMTYMMLVYHFVCLTLLVLTTRTNEDPNSISTMRLIIIATKSILTLQIVFGMLKWTNTILWSWYQSFVIFWLGFGIIILFELCLMADTVLKWMRRNEDSNTEEFRLAQFGNLWVNMYIVGYGILPSITLFCLCAQLHSRSQSISIYCLIAELIYATLISSYTYKSQSRLILFIRQIKERVDRSEQGEELQIQNEVQQPQRKIKMFSSSEQLAKVPQFLIKLSSTYYQQPSLSVPRTVKPESKAQGKAQAKVDMSLKFDMLISSPRQRVNEEPKKQATIEKDESMTMCIVCFDKENDMVNMPCGHGGLCETCAIEIFEKQQDCYLCREPINQILKVAREGTAKVKVIGFVRETNQHRNE